VGAVAVEFEFQRYLPRSALTRQLRDCDLVQVVAGSPAVALAASRCGRPVVLQVATRIVAERARAPRLANPLRRAWRSIMTGICDRLDTRALRHVSVVMVENDWMHEYVAGELRGGRGRVRMAHPGIDTERLRPCEPRRDDARPYILYVGRLADPRKNLPLLCAAYARLSASMSEVPELVLAGRGPVDAASAAHLAALPPGASVRLVESPDDEALLGLYQGALCLALPSDEEGFGLVVAEAMACGVPSVATRCGGPEGFVTDGEDGLLVPVGDAEAMAGALRSLAMDPQRARALGAKARQTIEARHSTTVAAQPFLEEYAAFLS
jgi:glycosyltransferase involved in cell wall biosynthesis